MLHRNSRRAPVRPLLLLLLADSVVRFTAAPERTPPAHDGVRLAFGSCSAQDEAQPLWGLIADRAPDAFAWLGDIVYADHPTIGNSYEAATLSEIAAAYAAQARVPQYAAFKATTPIVGIFDDHDAGVNDADVTTFAGAYREASQAHLLDFLGEPSTAPRRSRAGVYTAYVLDAPQQGGGRRIAPRILDADSASKPLPRRTPGGVRVRLILLDVRSHKDPFPAQPREEPSPSAAAQDMLGSAQWAWLEAQLAASTRDGDDVTIIGSGIQVLGLADPLVSESWGRMPQSLARLLSLLHRARSGTTNSSGSGGGEGKVILISGDVHFGELNALSTGAGLWGGGDGFLVEATSSGLSHSWNGLFRGGLINSLLLPLTRSTTSGGGSKSDHVSCSSNLPRARAASASRMALAAVGAPSSWSTALERMWGGDEGCVYTDLNWGEVDVTRDAVTLRVFGEDGAAHLERRIPLGGSATSSVVRPQLSPSLDAAVTACAAARMTAGLSPACRVVLDAVLPPATTRTLVLWYGGHVFAALLLGVITTLALALPFLMVRAERWAARALQWGGEAAEGKSGGHAWHRTAAAVAVGLLGTRELALLVVRVAS